METVAGAESGPDPTQAFTPRMAIQEELTLLRTARKSLGGEALKPIEIDMDIIAEAYPREGNFLASSSENSLAAVNASIPKTPSKKDNGEDGRRLLTARKTPNRRFFESDSEREYARNLMKELVQIYILQGVHGKEAFRQALNETRRRIHLRRGETPPTPPAILSPVHQSPYPKFSPPANMAPPLSEKKEMTAGAAQSSPDKTARRLDVSEESPKRNTSVKISSATPRKPSRVQSMVAAIQASTPGSKTPNVEALKKTPMSSRVKAVAESLESKSKTPVRKMSSPKKAASSDYVIDPLPVRKISSPKKTVTSDPVPDPLSEAVEQSPVRSSSRAKKTPLKYSPQKEDTAQTPPSTKKHQELLEKSASKRRGQKPVAEVPAEEPVSPPPAEGVTKRTRRVAAITAREEESQIAKKSGAKQTEEVHEEPPVKAKVAKPKTKSVKRKGTDLETIPEDESVAMPARPVRKAKTAANEGLIKK